MLRPEQPQIRPVSTATAVGVVSGVPAEVASVEYFGHDCLLTADLPGSERAPAMSVTGRLLAGEHLTIGAAVAISVSGTALAYPAEAARAVPAARRSR